MFLFLLVIALIFLIAGGIGLIFIFLTWDTGSANWIQGVITFGTFAVIGLASLGFLFVFPEEIE